LIINPKSGSAKDVDLDYIVASLSSCTELSRNSKLDEMYTDNFKNLAYVYPVVDGKVDTSDDALDIVLMNDSGKITGSLKIADQQLSTLPVKLTEDTFLVETGYGCAIVKHNGKVVHAINNPDVSVTRDFIIGEKAIYDHELEVVYDLVENDATVIGHLDSVVFVRTGTAKSFNLYAISADAETKLSSYSEENSTGSIYVPLLNTSCYALRDLKTGDYKYYNEEGTLLTTTKYLLEVVAYSAENNALILEGTDGSSTAYYIFSESAADSDSEKK